MFIFRFYVEAGGLMSYGVDQAPMMRRAASLVAKILRGASPADLPMDQPELGAGAERGCAARSLKARRT